MDKFKTWHYDIALCKKQFFAHNRTRELKTRNV